MKRAREDCSSPEFDEAHKSFHMALLDNANSPILQRYCGQLYDLNIRYRYLAAAGTNYQKRELSIDEKLAFFQFMNSELELGAAALGALAKAYEQSPSTDIFENCQKQPNPHAKNCCTT